MQAMQVKRVSTRDTYQIRSKVLRPGRPTETCHFEGDAEDQTFHLGAFIENRLVSIASFYFRKNPSFESDNQFQLRGMATLEEYRNKGLSRELLKVAFPMIKQNFCNLIWCNARVEAQGFYETVGFQTKGEAFHIEDVGDHILMYKEIES